MSAGPWGHRAAAAGAHGHLRASDADREQVLEVLKTAFAEGRLTMAELDARAGQALVSRTYGELAALTTDIPSGRIRVPPVPPPFPPGYGPLTPVPEPARTPASARLAVWVACVIAGLPAVWAAFLTFYGGFVILFLLAFAGLTLSIGPGPQGGGSATR